jgi:oligopeptide transport system permease protein
MTDQTQVAPSAAPGSEVSSEAASLWGDAWRQLRRDPFFLLPLALLLVFVVMAIAPQLFTDTSPRACSLSNSLGRPSADNWFGFDLQGCDYYARVVYGARTSISIGLMVTAVTVVIAVILGSLAGFYRGAIDAVIARVADIWFALPLVLGAIVILSVMPRRGILEVSLVIALFGWPSMLRLMRSSVLSVRESDYVQAARALGASDTRIIRRHVLPNAIAPVIAYATVFLGVVIVVEAALSFLGVGLRLPAISWGLMISVAQTRILQAPHLLFFPGLFLSLTVFSVMLIGDALRDALDPKLR